jgi:hypothetical protein
VKSFSRLFFYSVIILSAACAPKKVEVPLPEGRGLDAVLAERQSIERITTALSVVFEKKDADMYGDAVLDIARSGDLHLKVYTLGILGMDLSSRDGVVKSTPRLDRTKTMILTQGLRDSLFWWDLRDYAVREDGDYLVLQNAARSVWLDRKSLLPGKQLIDFGEGRQLTVLYDAPVKQDGVWYLSKMRIELQRYAVMLTVKDISFLKNR